MRKVQIADIRPDAFYTQLLRHYAYFSPGRGITQQFIKEELEKYHSTCATNLGFRPNDSMTHFIVTDEKIFLKAALNHGFQVTQI